jgi:two-component system LytT family sensor kinase
VLDKKPLTANRCVSPHDCRRQIVPVQTSRIAQTASTVATASVVWIFFATAQALLVIGFGTGTRPWWLIAVVFAIHAALWTGLSLLIRSWGRSLSATPRIVRVAGHVIAILAASVLDALVRREVSAMFGSPTSISFARTMLYYADVTTLSYILAVWLGRVLDAREVLLAHARHELSLRSQLARTRLAYLHAQLQPHFLFNALGAVSELIFENPAAAIRTFRQLVAVLRAAASRGTTEIPLREEIEVLQPYLEVQRARFSDWVDIELEIDPDATELRVPPLILQPLVENSIRHGLRDRSSRGRILIAARRLGGRLVLSVRDNGAGLRTTNGISRRGVGLSNTEERLRTLYGNDGQLRLFNDEAGGTVAEISMPLRLADVAVPEESKAPVRIRPRQSFADQHPIIALTLGCLIAGFLWTQQSYAYLVMSGRLGDTSVMDLARTDFLLVVMWTGMVPVVHVMSRRVPLAGSRWVLAAASHTGMLAVLGVTHTAIASLYRTGALDDFLPSFRGTMPLTLLVYLGALAYSERRLLEQWLGERQVAALRLNAEIAESEIAAASVMVSPDSLAFTLGELEQYAADQPLEAEKAIERLGSELRSTLELASSGDRTRSGCGAAPRREDGVERLAMGA